MQQVRPFFNTIQGLYPGRQPHFYAADDVPEVALLEVHAETIKRELQHNLATRPQACFRKRTLEWQKGWRQIELRIYGVDYPDKLKLFPETMDILGQIEGVSTIYFSVLSPQTSIALHQGDTDAYYRVHLGLCIPAGLPECGLEVAGEARAWKNGKCMVFNDIYSHSAWNNTDCERVVLIVDILRPEFRQQQVGVDARTRATLYHARLYQYLFPLIELLPRVLVRLIWPTLCFFSVNWHRGRVWLNARREGSERD